MPRVLVAGKIHHRGIDLLRSAEGIDVDYVEAISLDSYLPFIERADALLVRTQPVPAEAISRASRLRIVSRHGVGYDSVDVVARHDPETARPGDRLGRHGLGADQQRIGAFDEG